jgi:hypothetical protein
MLLEDLQVDDECQESKGNERYNHYVMKNYAHFKVPNDFFKHWTLYNTVQFYQLFLFTFLLACNFLILCRINALTVTE